MAIIKSYFITPNEASDGLWLTYFRMHEDGLLINCGYSQNYIIDYSELLAFKNGLLAVKESKDQIIVESENDDNTYLNYCSDDSIEVSLEDDPDLLLSISKEEFNDFIDILDLIILEKNLK